MKHITTGMARLERIRRNMDEILETHGEPTFRCPKCRDTGYVLGEVVLRLGHIYDTVRPCPRCSLGARIQARVEGEDG